MEMICPECRGGLVSEDGRHARCTTHGGNFKILYHRPAPAPVPQLLPPHSPSPSQVAFPVEAEAAPDPAAPPLPEAVGESAPFESPAGEPRRLVLRAAPPPLPASQAPAPEVATPSRYAAMRCVQHPSVPASAQCNTCGAYVCPTCDFALPRGLHVCPACAVASQTKLSPKRKSALYWTIGLAVWCTAGLAALFGGLFAGAVEAEGREAALGVLLMGVILLPAVIGLSIGMSTINRRLVNPPLLWVATIWNALVVGSFVILCVIGMKN